MVAACHPTKKYVSLTIVNQTKFPRLLKINLLNFKPTSADAEVSVKVFRTSDKEKYKQVLSKTQVSFFKSFYIHAKANSVTSFVVLGVDKK